MAQKKIGEVIHFYDKIGVAIIKLSAGLALGDEIKISGKFGEFSQIVESMEFEHKKIKIAKKGEEIGLKVDNKTKEGDFVYK